MKRIVSLVLIFILQLLQASGIDVPIDAEVINTTITQVLSAIALLWGLIGAVQALIKKINAGELKGSDIILKLYKIYSDKK